MAAWVDDSANMLRATEVLQQYQQVGVTAWPRFDTATEAAVACTWPNITTSMQMDRRWRKMQAGEEAAGEYDLFLHLRVDTGLTKQQ